MATYANPYAKGKPIKTAGSTIARGITRMATQFGQDAAAKKGKQQRDVDEAEALLTGRANLAETQYLKGYDAMKGDINKFSNNLSDENKNVFQEEIKKLLIAGRDDLSGWIRDNPEAGISEIKFRVEESLQGLTDFRTDLTHLNEARKQWETAKDLKPGEEGSIVGNYNPELIKLFEAQDRNDQDINLTMDDNNGLRFSLVNEQDLANAIDTAGEDDIVEFTTVNLTDLNKQASAGGGYFRTVEKPDFTDLREQIKQEIVSGNTEFGTAKDGEIVSINEDVVTDYINGAGKYENQPNGRGTFATYMDEEDQYGNWLYYGDDVEMQLPNGQVAAGRTNQLNNFNQDELRGYMVTDFVDSFGNIQRNNTSAPPPRKSSSSKKDTKKEEKPKETYEEALAKFNKKGNIIGTEEGWIVEKERPNGSKYKTWKDESSQKKMQNWLKANRPKESDFKEQATSSPTTSNTDNEETNTNQSPSGFNPEKALKPQQWKNEDAVLNVLKSNFKDKGFDFKIETDGTDRIRIKYGGKGGAKKWFDLADLDNPSAEIMKFINKYDTKSSSKTQSGGNARK